MHGCMIHFCQMNIPYKSSPRFLKWLNRHGCWFLNFHYYNFLLSNVCLPKYFFNLNQILYFKLIDAIYYGGFHFEILKRQHNKVHINESQNKDFKHMFIIHNFFEEQKQIHFKRTFKNKVQFWPFKSP
jgi:hypothetical protein